MNIIMIVFITLLYSTLFATTNLQAQVVWLQANLNCQVDQGNAVCTVTNTGNMPMFCEVQAIGVFPNGQFLRSNVQQWIYPGQYLNAYVYTSYPEGSPRI